MAGLFVDTTVLVDALRRRGAAERFATAVAEGPVPLICAVNVEELWRGARPGEEAGIERLLRGLRIVPLEAAEGERAGGWRRDFAARGITLAQGDCLIAAAAVSAGARLATANAKDFPMPGLVVEDWSTA